MLKGKNGTKKAANLFHSRLAAWVPLWRAADTHFLLSIIGPATWHPVP